VRSPDPNREVFRLVPPLIVWWVWVAFAVANVADFAIEGAPARFAIVVSAILVTITGLAYALALRPRVIAEPSGLTIVNPFRDHHVPWAAIQAVDTGDWVRVHYAPGEAAADPPGPAAASPRSSAASKAISCWSLYISARTRRRATLAGPAPGFARAASRPRSHGILSPALPGTLTAAGQEPANAGNSRLPEEAKYLASLPAAKAIAVRLDTRAGRERARPGQAPAAPAHRATGQEDPVTARCAWSAVAAVALPVLALVVVLLA
jgi:PH (Pleckstrin Homology) domain-containing protein